jgi:type IV pilus assembly protein PilC
VVSVFSDIFSQLGGDMPTPTKYLITISNLLEHNLLLFLLVVAAIVGGWLYYIRTTPGRAFWDARRIRLPVVGPIAHNICLARFARSMSSLVKSGIPILEVMALVQNTVGNAEMESAIKSAAVEIESGEQISTSLGRHPIFPAMIIGMMSVGEQSGRIDSTLEMVADFLDKDVETALGGLAPLIEPLLILFLGVVVGTIVICMFLPIFKLNDLVTGKH